MELPEGEYFPFPGLYNQTDVWSLGLVIWELMYSTVDKTERENMRSRLVKDFNFDDFDAEGLEGNKGRYSKALHVLRDRCLHIDPNRRPTPHIIALECARNLEDQLPNTVGTFSNGHIDPHLRLDYKREQFELHVKFTKRRAKEGNDT